ncbi:hypothetical protein [Shimia aestuarii]|uniref:hypothetical protein n=1 Tax=Shimia aestuarii TaxID=254406 RepID=UPI001FB36703|nr:hypothetical protein [Shimia aestuarii]
MTRMEVKSGEHGLIRLFSVDLPPEQLAAFNSRSLDEDNDKSGWPLRDALGAGYLDEDFIEYFDVADLEEIGLTGYMTEGLGIAEADVAADAARLSKIEGHVLIVHSNAFDGIAQTLTPAAPLRWIGTWSEDKPPVQYKPLPNPDPEAHLEPRGETRPEMTPHTRVLFAIFALPILLLGLGGTLYALFIYLN